MKEGRNRRGGDAVTGFPGKRDKRGKVAWMMISQCVGNDIHGLHADSEYQELVTIFTSC